MIIEYDEIKNQRNIKERGLPFALVANMDVEATIVIEDNRMAYAEQRLIMTGPLGNRVHVACVTPIAGGYRVISFRKANRREVKKYEQESTNR